MKLAALTLAAIALAAVFLVSPASAIIPCEFCSEESTPYDRCIGVCNGIFVQFCFDYFHLGCTPLLRSAAHPLDAVFPMPSYLQTDGAAVAGGC